MVVMVAVVGSFVCCSVVVLFVCCCVAVVLFEPFKVMLSYSVVACKDNSKVVRCRNDGVINRAVNRAVNSFVSVDGLGDGVVDKVENE